MSNYIHLFETQTAHDAVYNGSEYTEPWIGLVTANNSVSYNSEYQKYKNMPFTIEALGSGTLSWNLPQGDSISYSKNEGDWTTFDNTTSISVVEGDKIKFKGEITNVGNYLELPISLTGSNFNATGNIMSISNGDNFINVVSIPRSHQFYGLFKNSTIISAKHLILPAQTLTNFCYGNMFEGCSGLIAAPEFLPATTMFAGCYQAMFRGCTSLTTAPDLPATTLQAYCYRLMFKNCSSLTTAPELPATILQASCYEDMFQGCSNLNYIKCLATSISSSYCTAAWVEYVSSTGTFVKNPSMTSWTTGIGGIPTGWTVVDAS